MNPRFINIGGQKLAYFESESVEALQDSPSVLFVHGISISSRSFMGQMESTLGRKYRLVALDLPGHGLSDPARDPVTTYTMSGLAGIICEFAERVGLKDTFFVGWSLGGNLLIEAIDLLPSVRGLMLIGSFIPSLPIDMALMAYPHPALGSLFKADLTDNEIDTLAESFLKLGAFAPSFLLEDIGQSDKSFRPFIGEAIGQGRHKDEASIVACLKTPFAFVLGAEDQILRASYLRSLVMPSLWRDDLQIIPDAGHLAQWEQPERFNRLLEEFIEEVR